MGNKKKAISPYYVITLILLAAMAVFFSLSSVLDYHRFREGEERHYYKVR